MATRGLGESQALAFHDEAPLGQVIAGTYRVTRQIGAGASSRVFEAQHIRLERAFAVKILRADIDPGKKTAQRFRREAQAIGRIDSPHVVSVVDCGELLDHTPYLVMELLRGEDLRSLLERQGQLPLQRAVHIIIEACHGLSAVHQAGLVHRDIKPENIFITSRPGGEDWCKLLDFGVAKMHSTLSTAAGAILGTARYMAPEQFAASAEVEQTADVYALGAVLFECLSGHPVHDGETVHQVMYQAMNVEPPALTSACPPVPRSVADIVRRCLSKRPAERPRSTAELAQQLAVALSDERIDPAASTLSEDIAVSERRVARRRFDWRAPAALALGAGLFAGWWVGSQRRTVEPAKAQSPPVISLAEPKPLSSSTLLMANPPSTPPISSALPSSAAQPPKLARTRKATFASSAPPPSLKVGDIDVANPYGQ